MERAPPRVAVMRNRADESGGTSLVVHSPGATGADISRMTELAAVLEGALTAVRGAARTLAHARLLVDGLSWMAPLNTLRALGALDDAGSRGASLADVELRLEELRRQVVAAAAVYEEAENAAAAVIADQSSAVGLFGEFLLGTVSPLLGVPRWGGAVVRGALLVLDALGDSHRGVPTMVNVQGHLRPGARLLGPWVNPTGRVLLPRGWVRADETTPVEFLSSSLLDLTGLDHFNGNVDVWVRDPLTGAPHLSSVREWDVTARSAVPIGASVAIAPLRSVPDVLARLRSTAAGADRTGVGRIELVAQTGTGGATTWTVVLPGTRETFMAANPQDHLSNVQLVGGERDDLLLAANQALRAAPIAEGDSVVFVGHSQGGIVAAELAADPAVREQFDVAGVVTMGSPIGQVTGIPSTVPVISLENVDDVVPALDGLANTVEGDHLTLQFDGGAHSAVLGPHNLWTYEAAYERAVAQGDLAAADSELRQVANWADPGSRARVYTFEFERTGRAGSLLDSILHLGYERR